MLVVLRLLDARMPVSALATANRYGVQFRPGTLERWRDASDGARRTYLWLIESDALARAE